MSTPIKKKSLIRAFDSESTIERCPHDKENPYAQISRNLIRDASISPECRWLIIYLLSMKDGWQINVKQVQSHVKPFMGKDKLYRVINEAIEAGYMYREKITQINENGSTNFAGIKYYLSESCKFKKSFLRPENPDTENPDPENPDSKEGTSAKKEHKQELSVAGASPAAFEKSPKPIDEPPELIDKPPEIPRSITITSTNNVKIQVTHSSLYSRVIKYKLNWTAEAIAYAWDCLSKYNGIVHDWWRFIEGTVNNYNNKKKSQQINKSRKSKCLKNKSYSSYKETSSEAVTPEPASQKSLSLADLLNQQWPGCIKLRDS